jgi:hypothetical protein
VVSSAIHTVEFNVDNRRGGYEVAGGLTISDTLFADGALLGSSRQSGKKT